MEKPVPVKKPFPGLKKMLQMKFKSPSKFLPQIVPEPLKKGEKEDLPSTDSITDPASPEADPTHFDLDNFDKIEIDLSDREKTFPRRLALSQQLFDPESCTQIPRSVAAEDEPEINQPTLQRPLTEIESRYIF